MDEETVLAAISVFGARARGVTTELDTADLAARLRDTWAAEGHAPHRPGAGAPPVDTWPLRLRRAVVGRLPLRRRAQLRRLVQLVRSFRSTTR